MLREALTTVGSWNQAGGGEEPLAVSVNVSRNQAAVRRRPSLIETMPTAGLRKELERAWDEETVASEG